MANSATINEQYAGLIKLDFSLTTAVERKNFVDNYFAANSNCRTTKNELETIANYILYGKDVDGLSAVDKKEIEIDTKYKSYQKKRPESLDYLVNEAEGFNEATIVTKRTKYVKKKPKISRELDSDVPGIVDLWKTIDFYQHIINVNEGKETDDKVKKYSKNDLYKIKHMIISMRQDQFLLKDSVKPTTGLFSNAQKDHSAAVDSVNWDLYAFYPLGLYCGDKARFINPREYRKEFTTFDELVDKDNNFTIDFTNPDHLYYIFENYEELKIYGEKDIDSTANSIADTVDFYISITPLTDERKDILRLKMRRYSNAAIQKYINQKYGLKHTINYISTIYKQKICPEIAAKALLHYDYFLNRFYPENFKRCNQCGEWKLRDNREFMKKSKAPDKLSCKCKKCEKVNRALIKRKSSNNSNNSNNNKGGNTI